ncbi:MAG: M20/M25/M40 family metallo-hydrolase [Bacteroidales bacterium]|nr:M20/M25/M40 family metallo-hydrolase [Bacteroidales bacterium]
MKTKRTDLMKIFIRIIIILLLAIIPILLLAQTGEAQLVDKRPDPQETMTRFPETPYASQRYVRAADPGIAAMVNAINADTLRATLQEMQAWGSRFLMNDNKKEIAISLLSKFQSYGYTNVKLDSFYLVILNWNGLSDSSWQYNVVCTLPGSSAPEEIYVVGGHWDSICLPDPVNDAPGVDDNGTAVAATLEIARVMKLFNYQPEATIQFTLFAAEELGLFGSRDAASKARMAGTDIRYMLNMDMISNNPANIAEVKIYQYYGFEWAGFVAAEATESYTDLAAVIPQNLVNSGSDSFPYWLEGFPSTYFEEIVFSPNWHKPSDTLGNCNVPYLKKVTGGALATLAEQQLLPYPQNLWAQSGTDEITLTWGPTRNAFVKGFNVYRSENSGTGFQKVNSTPVADSVYYDIPALLNKQYYYVITTVNDSLHESAWSNEVIGARFNFCDSLLVIANVKGNKTTPDSVLAFYQSVLDTIPYKWIDINAEQKVSLDEFSRYRSILWLSNTLEFESLTYEMALGIFSFMENGGNLLFSGFSPSRFWINDSFTYPLFIPETTLFHRLFKVDSVDRKLQSMLFRANSVAPGYDTLNIDPLKYMDKSFPGQIYNVDVFAPSDEAIVIYRFDSHFDSTTSMGKMKHKPVGIEYMGADHKSILLSFPLYYLDTTDAREFLHYVVTKKFGNPVGILQTPLSDPFALQVFPNPVKESFNITFTLAQPGPVKLTLLSPRGQPVVTWVDRRLERGTHWFRFGTASLTPGLYGVLLQQGGATAVRKIILVR